MMKLHDHDEPILINASNIVEVRSNPADDGQGTIILYNFILDDDYACQVVDEDIATVFSMFGHNYS